MIHVVNKGKEGEREVVKLLQPIVDRVYTSLGMEAPSLLRNQMQSAVGGYDIVGLDWLALEVKRQETLTLNQWWNQVLASARPTQEPVVIFRQNRKKWRVLMYVWVHTGGTGHQKVRAEVSIDDWLAWVEERMTYEAKKAGELVDNT